MFLSKDESNNIGLIDRYEVLIWSC